MRVAVIPRTTLLAIFLLILNVNALAAEKRVTSSQIRNVVVSAQGKNYRVVCLAKVPGKTTTKKRLIYFSPLKDEQTTLSRSRKTSAIVKRLALLKILIKNGTTACTASSGSGGGNGGGGTGGGAGGAVPDYLSLEPYQGAFGFDEAQILFNRFAFGATPQQLKDAVTTGMSATVSRLFSLVDETMLESEAADIECDNWFTGDPQAGNQNRQCDPANVNDLSRGGMRTALLYRFINSKNPLYQRLAFFLMDERMSVSANAARDCERHSIRTYLKSVYQGALTGDYRHYMESMNVDHLMHLRSLDGGTNHGGLALAPNENYAREFWELGTVAPTDLSGKPVYSDLDVANSALAFTGWNIDDVTVNGNNVCLASWVPLFHSGGNKTIFGGTPYQATVENADDVLAATFNHPRLAEHLAEDLWKEFVNPFATPTQIQQLAKIIRDNNYNLLPTLKTLMASKAMYAAQSRNSLIKHPLDLVIGFVKATGFPLYYRNYDGLLNRLEEQVLNPATVFGWDVKYLSGQQLQIEWWNALMDYFINVNIDDLKNESGFTYYKRFVEDLNAAGQKTSGAVIDRVAKDLGVPITPAQKAELDQMMNFYLSTYQCPTQCNGQPFKLIRNQYDTDPASTESGTDWNGQRRLRMLITALMELPSARTK